MELREREKIEWMNLWWEKANNPDVKRWVLLGDSVARQYRGRLQEKVEPEIAIDFWGTSFQLEDPGFQRELENFLEKSDYNYDVALITWGGHHGLSKSIIKADESFQKYFLRYEELLKYMMRKCREVVIIAATHEVLSEDLKREDVIRNQQIQVRNEISSLLAQQYGLRYVDLYTAVYENKSLLHHVDHVHFERDAYEFMVEYILKNMGQSVFLPQRENNLWLYKKRFDNIRELEDVLKHSGKIVLYGAGMVGQVFEKYITVRGYRIECIVVSDDRDLSEISGVQSRVCHFSEILPILEKCTIIVAMQEDRVSEIMQRHQCTYWKPSDKVIEFIKEYVNAFCE